MICLEIVLYRLSTSNHNIFEIIIALELIVLYRLSTSNHNTLSKLFEVVLIVLYRLSTSNHNWTVNGVSNSGLSYIVFLHQTTTEVLLRGFNKKLSYIVFLHQTTTQSAIKSLNSLLSYIVFLHQTTTSDISTTNKYNCLISSFYIKPQLLI